MKRIIFDLDNTLISNVNFNLYVEKAFEQINEEYTQEDIKAIQRAIKDYEVKAAKYEKELMLQFYRSYTGRNLKMSFLNAFLEQLEYALPDSLEDGVVETLEYLTSKYELSVLTNWFEHSQKMRMKNAGILEYFTDFCGAECYKKPMQESYRIASGINELKDVVMIGDSYQFDYLGAKNAGINAILLDKKDEHQELRDERISSIKELKRKF